MMENQEPEQKEDRAEKWADITTQIQKATQTAQGNKKEGPILIILALFISISICFGVLYYLFFILA